MLGIQFQAAQTGRDWQAIAQVRLGQQQGNATVFEHVAQAVLGVFRVQRHIGTTGFDGAQQADDHLQAAFHGDAHQHIRAHALLTQLVRQLVGPAIQFGVGQGLLAKGQRRGVRGGGHLGFDQLVNAALVRVYRLGSIPAFHHQLLFRQAQHWQFTDHCVSPFDQRLQQVGKVTSQAANGLVAPQGTVVAVLHRQRGAQCHHQRQRVIGLLLHGHIAKAQATGRALLQRLGHRVVLEHQDAVEQGVTALPRPALHIVQRGVLELAHGQVAGLHLADPLGHGLLGTRGADHRQGVDEQADLLLYPRQVCRAAGDRGAEAHAGLAGAALQQQQPGRLHQGVDRDPVGPGKGFDACGLLAVEGQAVVTVAAAARTAGDGLGQAGWLVQYSELALPEGFGNGRVLASQPANVVAVMRDLGLRHQAGIALQHLTQQARGTPAVHEDVVVGVDQVVAGITRAHQHQAQQRRSDQVETALALTFGHGLQRLLQVRLAAPVVLAERQLDGLAHHLHGLLQLTLQNETATQDVVGIERGQPGLLEALHIQPVHIHAQLVDVVAGLLVVEGVEQHALLHR
ncbi:hypothetical protein D3C81_1057870 [compost metagenome]